MSGKEEEIYNILNEKKEIDEKSPKLRTEDEKKKLKSLSYKISKFPKDLINDIKTKFSFLQRKPKTAEQRKEQMKECHRRKRSAESEVDKETRLTQDKESHSRKRSAESEKERETRLEKKESMQMKNFLQRVKETKK